MDVCCTHSSLVTFGVTGPKLTKFMHDVDEPLLTRLLAMRYFNPF